MPIKLNFKIRPTKNNISLDTGLLRNHNKDWVVWWHNGLYETRAGSQPLVEVAFRSLKNGMFSDGLNFSPIPLTNMGKFRIGTIWRDEARNSEIVFDTHKFNVDFDEDAWGYIDCRNSYPLDIHQVQDKSLQTQLLEFPLNGRGSLFIPCLEFFYSCYGHSSEIKRILATYPWRGSHSSVESRLLLRSIQQESDNSWHIQIPSRKGISGSDAVFLAHLKYDDYAQNSAKQIYAQTEAAIQIPGGKETGVIYLKARPWFKGSAKIKVAGKWCNNKKSFLALRVLGMSQPDGDSIIRHRTVGEKLTQNNEDGTEAEAVRISHHLNNPIESVQVTSTEDPDYYGDTIEITDDAFEILGNNRQVVDRWLVGDKHFDVYADAAEESTRFSGGVPQGRGNEVGHVSFTARLVLESNGVLQDMWKAAVSLSKTPESPIEKVDWFTFDKGYSAEPVPELIPLPLFNPVKKSENSDNKIINWVYFDTRKKKFPRGILVIRLIIAGVSYFIIEIQRRPLTKKDEHGQEQETEESFKGLIFTLKDQSELGTWLHDFIFNIRFYRGVMANMVRYCPGKAYAFVHRHSKHESVNCGSIISRALKHMSIQLNTDL